MVTLHALASMLFSTSSAIALSGLLCDRAMMVIAFQSSPILSLPRAARGLSRSISRLRSLNAAALLQAPGSSTSVSFREHAVALQVDNLLGLRERKRNRIVPAVMGIGAHEAM